MSDSSKLISSLRVVAEEISRFREEIQAVSQEIKGLAKALSSNCQAKTSKQAVLPDQTREDWLKEAAVRASQKLFTG